MKRIITFLLAVVMITALLAGCGSTNSNSSSTAADSQPQEQQASEGDSTEPVDTADAGEPVTLVFSIAAVPGDAHAEAQKIFKETVERVSGGNITVECYDSGTLFNQSTETAAVIAGDCDMIYSSASWLTTNSPWLSMFTAGYMFKSYEHMTTVFNGAVGQEVFARVAEEQGIVPLGAYYLGTRQISLAANKEIKTPADLNGVNLRMPDSDAWVFLGKAMGANPTPIAFNDLYLALQTGTVDGQDNPLPTVESAKFYEVQDSISITNHLVDSVWPTMNQNTWNSLTDQQKAWVMEGVEAAREYCDKTNLEKEERLVQFFTDEGLSIYYADIDTFASEVLAKYLEDETMAGSWDMDLYEKVQALG